MNFDPIAHIYNDFPTKFGLPRQSGMSEHLISRIVMEKDYRNIEAFRGIEEFEYLWLIWVFESMGKRPWSPTVRPPKLGGNRRMGVFATRSPNRPNPIGLTKVKLIKLEQTAEGPVLTVSGADLMSGTPIFDIKPYLAFTDSHPDATGGFTEETFNSNPSLESITFTFNSILTKTFDPEHLKTLKEILLSDPRPHYHDDADRVYALEFAGKEVKFRIRPNQIEAWIE